MKRTKKPITTPQQLRQGDVLLLPATIPAGAKALPLDARARGVVLAWGETTGHAHVVEADAKTVTVELLERDGVQYLRVTGGEAYLRHGTLSPSGKVRQLAAPEHGPHVVPPGEYLVPGQCTWTTEQGAQRVAD